MRTATVVLIAFFLTAGRPGVTQSPSALPADTGAFKQKVRDAVRLDYEIQKEFTYIERRRDIRLSKLGKVTVGALRTFEVYPAVPPGRTYKRLIEVDGRPLDAMELARRDAERQRTVREMEERRRAETPRQREARLKAEANDRQEREAILDDALAIFEPTFTRRDAIEGQPVFVAQIAPQPGAGVRTREGRWLKEFAGEVWISTTDYQIVRLDMRALDDVSIGWGIVGRVSKGSRFVFARRKVEETWLPAEVTFEASGRTLFFRKFQIATTTTFSDYRRLRP
jgi:ribosomal protein S21